MILKLYSYKSKLPHLFELERARIIKSIPQITDIHHVGSTSVPGLGGKNIIDIVIGLDEYKNLEELTKEFEKLGYRTDFIDYEKEWTLLQSKKDTSEGDYQVHIIRKNSKNYKEWFLFRDYLRTHKREADKYLKLKHKWLKESRGDRKKYTEIKAEYVQSVLKKAKIYKLVQRSELKIK